MKWKEFETIQINSTKRSSFDTYNFDIYLLVFLSAVVFSVRKYLVCSARHPSSHCFKRLETKKSRLRKLNSVNIFSIYFPSFHFVCHFRSLMETRHNIELLIFSAIFGIFLTNSGFLTLKKHVLFGNVPSDVHSSPHEIWKNVTHTKENLMEKLWFVSETWYAKSHRIYMSVRKCVTFPSYRLLFFLPLQ